MSYCRWSCDDFQCDLYVYESCEGGFMTYVGRTRLVFAEPLPHPVPFSFECEDEWLARHKKVSEMVEKAESFPIGLPHDGETFVDATAGDCAERLERLRALGYRVPQYAIDALWAESADE